jgi:hypothetical protein
MALDDAKEKITEIETQIQQAEEAYSNALKARKDYNTLKSIRTDYNFQRRILGHHYQQK